MEKKKNWSPLIQQGMRLVETNIPDWLVGILEAFFPKKILFQMPQRTYWAYYFPIGMRDDLSPKLWQELGIPLSKIDLPVLSYYFIAVVEEFTPLVEGGAELTRARDRHYRTWNYVMPGSLEEGLSTFSTQFYVTPDVIWMFLWLDKLQHQGELDQVMGPWGKYEFDETGWFDLAHEEAERQATAKGISVYKFIKEELKHAFPEIVREDRHE